MRRRAHRPLRAGTATALPKRGSALTLAAIPPIARPSSTMTRQYQPNAAGTGENLAMVKLQLGNHADVNVVGRFMASREGSVLRWSGSS